MSFFVYLAVLLFAGASALFGLDLMTAPLPPNPPTQAASTSTPNKLEKREAEQKTADKQASNSDRALTPVYPASPGGAKSDVRMVYPPTNATTGTAPPEEKSASAPQQPAPSVNTAEAKAPAPAPAPAQEQATAPAATSAKAEPVAKNEPPAAAPAESTPTQAVAQQTAGRCDVQACASAYRSFRESDCSYQPFEGPRRLCEAPPSAQARTARAKATDDARPQRSAQRSKKDELRDVVQRVKELTQDDDDAAAADDDVDVAPAPGTRRGVIVLQRSFSGWRWEDDN